MALYFPLTADHLTRSATYLNRSTSWTRLMWCWQGATSAGSDFRQYFVDGDTSLGGNAYIYLGSGNINIDHVVVETFDGATTQDTNEFTPTASTWFWTALVYNSTSHVLTFYANSTTPVGTISINLSTVTFTDKLQAVSGASHSDLSGTFIREWQAALNTTELTAEIASPTAVRQTNLLTDTPIAVVTDVTDASGHNRGWAKAGTPTNVTGPFSAPTNITATSATAISSLPQTVTADMLTSYSVWFSYLTVSGDTELSAFASADGGIATAGLEIYDGTAAAPTLYEDFSTALRQPLAPPVSAATTYYFKVINPSAPTALGVNASFALERQPALFIPSGSILIGDDSFTNPPVIVSATSSSVLGITNIIGGTQFMDTVSSGKVLMDDESIAGELRIFDSDLFTEGTPIALTNAPTIDGIRSDRNNTWFVATTHAGTETVYAISGSGVVSGTSWVLPSTVWTLAPRFDDTILYWTHYDGVAADMAIHRWDLVNNIALSDLIAADSPYFVTQDMLSLTDGTLLIGYSKAGPPHDFKVKHVAANGTIINTFDLGDISPDATLNYRMSLSPDETSFWIKTNPILGTNADTQLLQQIRISDGTILAANTFATFSFGFGPETASPDAPVRFGPGPSTPIAVLMAVVPAPVGGSSAPPFTTITYPVRRLRRSPHLSNQQLRQTIHMFQLDLEAGVGLSDGSDPQIMLRWSDDGGHTWSNEHWVGAGQIGQFKRRALWRLLGSSRDRIWEIVVNDPVRWRFLQAFTDVTVGIS